MFHKVYQLCSQIPRGKVSTYKIIAQFAYDSPTYARRVGTLLSHCPDCKTVTDKQNYDCPRIHCYRVIKSDFQVGGFLGEVGKEKLKAEKLTREGVLFNQEGYLLNDLRDKVIFKNFCKYEN